MCCFARPMCLTFVEVKFMGKKKLFSFLEPLLVFNSGLCWCIFWSRIVTDREDGDIFWSQWWLQRQLWPFPQPSLSQNSFQAVIQSPLQIFNRNIKHLIISKERDAAWWPWKANMQARQGSLVHGWSKVQMFCAGAGGKTNTGCAQCCSVTMGDSFLGRGRKSRIPLFVIWVRKFAGGIMKEASNFIWKAGTRFDALIFCSNEGFFSDQLGGTPMWKIPHFCSCLMVCKSFISVGTAKWFCNSPNQKKKKKKDHWF